MAGKEEDEVSQLLYCGNCANTLFSNSHEIRTDGKGHHGSHPLDESHKYQYYVVNSNLQRVSNIKAIMDIYRISCKLVDIDASNVNIPLCDQCSDVLSNLYRLHEQFVSLRKLESVISQMLTFASSELNPEILVEYAAGSSTPIDIISEAESSKLMNEGSVTRIVVDSGQLGDEVSEVSHGEDILVSGDAVSNVVFLNTSSLESLQQLESCHQPHEAWIQGGEAGGGEKLGGVCSSPEKPSWELPRSTTAIAVPIGENLLQLYRVAPIIPTNTKPPYECLQCGKVKKSLISLRNHIHNVHTSHRGVSCPHCQKIFKKPCLLRKHQVIHQEGYVTPQEKRDKRQASKPLLTCSWPKCGRSFQYNTSLQRHEARHRPERPYVCPNCSKGFKLVGDLRMHMKFHKESRPYVCEKCGKSYKVASNLNSHNVNAHTEAGRLKYNEYMRSKTKLKKMNKLAASSSSSNSNVPTSSEEKMIEDTHPCVEHVVHEDFPDFIVAEEAEIETEEISEDFT